MARASLDPLAPGDLGERREEGLVASAGGAGLLRPYARFDPALRPVALVHGIKGHPGELRAIADRLLARGDVQPYVFLYDDHARYLDRSGDDLARALAELACRRRGARLVIVAHSMGGIVARCAINSLVDPRWLHHHGDGDPCVGDFAAIDLMSVDTPWSGFLDPAIDLRKFWPGERSWVDMVSNSDVLTRLHAPPLPPHVEIHHVEADQGRAGLARDKIRTLGDLDDRDLAKIQRAILGDASALGDDHRVRNMFAAFADEASFPALQASLRASGPQSPAELREALMLAVPRLAGSHTSVLGNTALFALIDRMLAA